MMHKLFAWIHTYEVHLSAAAMIAGFVVDNIFFTRIDLPQTHALFIGYLVFAAGAIILWHWLEEHAVEGTPRSRWRSMLPITTQFMFGGLWSGFLIFYSRSATVATSWPFLLVLGGIFLGNEIFKKYHDRLVFNAILFFFALYSYAIFAVPVFTHALGTTTFLLSGVCAVAVFTIFLLVLRKVGRMRFLASVWPIRIGATVILVLINAFYFLNILPPLPLALSDVGVYHSISKTSTGYLASAEVQPWYTSIGFSTVEHLAPQESLVLYSAVFAPVALTTKIVHRWEHYDPVATAWKTQSVVSFAISGGRDGGYRGYSIEEHPQAGKWRVDIETPSGLLIGRVSFTVESVATGVATEQKVLK